MKFLIKFLVIFLFLGCSVSDYQQIATAIISKKPSTVIKTYASKKATYYATHPGALIRDIKYFKENFNLEIKKFLKFISTWRQPKKPGTKTLVKYTNNYKARAIINFSKGYVRVETIAKDYKNVLKKALVNTMLMPDDPRSVDLFSDKIVLKGKPFLAGQIYDYENKLVLYKWRASRYADWLIKHKLKSYLYKGQKVYFVTFNLAKNSLNVRVKRYLPYVEENSKRFNISKTLILAIIKTESDFNSYATSYVPAFGLMQIVPTTAGVEAWQRVYGYKHIPSKEYLYVPKNNIKMGTAYLNILFYRYLREIKNPISREYCAISSYNAGIGNVLKVFSIRRDRAFDIINSLSPKEVYTRLTMRLKTSEAKGYLPKVIKHKKLFIGY